MGGDSNVAEGLISGTLFFSTRRATVSVAIAANPDLASGAYNQWGWVSGILSNPVWYGTPGNDEPSRRQWYATYFMGRVTSKGLFEPMHMYGYSSQGQVGPKQSEANFQNHARTAGMITRLRPDQPAGMGLVVSWAGQEKSMGAEAGRMGFGLYVAKGRHNVDELTRSLYPRLIDNGLPISFVTSTHALQQWRGTNPLVLVGEASLEAWEVQALERLNAAGTPLVVVGNVGTAGDFETLFGVRRTGDTYVTSGAKAIDMDGRTVAYLMPKQASRGPRLFCPIAPEAWDGRQSVLMVKSALAMMGEPLSMPPGISATPFVSNQRLFLALADLA